MPSSTSSSDRVAARTLVAGAGVLLAAMVVVRGCTAAFEAYLPNPFGVVKVKSAFAALPGVAAAPGPKAIFFGSSLVELGFAPEVFDARLHESGIELTSYNFGVGNLNPSLQLVFAKRMREEWESRDERVELMLIEFNPFQATEKRVQANARFREAALSVFSTPRTLWAEARADPDRAARMATIKYIRDGVAAQAITTLLGSGVAGIADALSDDEAEPVSEETQRARDERRDLALELYWKALEEFPDAGPFGSWEPRTRGASFRPEDVSPEFLELTNRFMKLMQYPEFLKSDLESRIRCCDIVELHFNEGLVRDFIALVHELAAISDRIEVVLMPRNYDWVKNPPEALDRQRTVVTRIERETGAAVRDYQHLPELDGRYFFDVSHLILHEGQDRFSTLLAEDWVARF